MKLSELGEERLLEQLLPGLPLNNCVEAGAGDDCAVVRRPASESLLLLKTDCLVHGVHFTAAAKPSAVGWKAMARPLSDFAAMSGLPQFALVTLLLPPSTTKRWVMELYRGLARAARAFDVAIVGGETSRIDGPASVGVSLVGTVGKNRWVSRGGGKPGDALFVTGKLGGSIRGRHLKFTPRIIESRWLTKHFHVHAMMDLSDGLGADLPRLARASKVGWEIEERAIPRSRGCSLREAISDGEDYELLFAISADDAPALHRAWNKKFPKLALTQIGRLNHQSKISNQQFPTGYAHFQ